MELMIPLNIVRTGGMMWAMDKIELPTTSAVYFVYNRHKTLIYIGQTTNLLRRTVQHFRAEKWFKLHARYISFVDTPEEELNTREYAAIREFRPRYNYTYGSPARDEMREVTQGKPFI